MMTVGSPSEDALLSQRGAEAAGEVAQPVGVANPTLRYVNRKNVAILALVCLLTFGVYFCYDLPAALFSHFKALAGGSSTAYEVLYSVYSLPNTVLPIAGGALSDGWLGPHRCVTVACTLVAAGSALVAVGCGTGSFPLAVSGRFVMGLGGETVFGLQQTLCSFWFPVDLQPLAMSITLTMGNLGEVLNFIATKRIEQLVGFANTCWLAVVPCVLSMGAGVWLGVLSQDRQFCRSIRCESASVPRSSSSSPPPPPPPPPLPSTRPSMATIPPSPSYTEEVAATWSPLVRDGGDIDEEEALRCVSEAVLARRHLHTEKAHQAAPGLEQARISPSQADNSGGSLLYHSMDGREDAAASADDGDDRAHSDGVDRGAWKKTSQGGWRRQAFSAVCTAETVPLYLVNMGCMGNYFIFPSMASDVLSDAWPGSTGAERSSLLALYFAIPMVLSPIAGVALGREGGASTSKPSVLAAWLTAGCAANAAGFALLSWAAAAGGGGGGGSTSLLHRAGPAPGIVLVAAATAVVGATLTPCLALVVDGTFHGTAFGIWSGTQNLALAALALGVGAIADARSPNAAVAFLALCGAASTASAAVLWAIATRERPKPLLNGSRLRVATEVSF